jgi:hypothetical protein
MSSVYIISEGDAGPPVKIGVANNPLSRISELQTGNPRKLRLARAWNMATRDGAFAVERAVLSQLSDRRLSGEWVDATESEVAALIVNCNADAL